MAADYPGALWMPVPQQLIWPGHNDHKWLVIHKTGGPGDAVAQATFFAGPNNVHEASTHYIVGQDGTVVQCVSERDGAGGNCCVEPGHASFLPASWGTSDNGNWHTISIEHCDPALDNSTPVTPAQQEASFRLIKDICQRHGIPMRPGDVSGGIIGHKDIAAQSRQHCPGNYPWQALWDYLKGEDTTMQLYTEQSKDFSRWFDPSRSSEHVWLCKNGKTLQYALKSLYQQLSLDGQTLPVVGLPLTGERRITIKHRETGKDTEIVVQPCERCAALIYDPAHALDAQPGLGDAYLAHITDPRIAALIPGLTLTPEPAHAAIDTTAAESAIHAMVDGLASSAARALVEVQKLRGQ